MKAKEGSGVTAPLIINLWARQSGNHAPAVLLPGKNSVPIEKKGKWAPKLILTNIWQTTAIHIAKCECFPCSSTPVKPLNYRLRTELRCHKCFNTADDSGHHMYNFFNFLTLPHSVFAGHSGRAVWGVDMRPLVCCDCGFESHRGAWTYACCECCQVEVSVKS
jgi:hypothetical protein